MPRLFLPKEFTDDVEARATAWEIVRTMVRDGRAASMNQAISIFNQHVKQKSMSYEEHCKLSYRLWELKKLGMSEGDEAKSISKMLYAEPRQFFNG